MSTERTIKLDAEGVFCELKSSHDGQARLFVVLARVTSHGTRERYEINLTVARSSIHCVYQALRQFSQREQAEIQALVALFEEPQA